jgi:high-affinity nickel-transport protein
MDALLSAGVLGLLLGMQHATDPDHVVAVATILTGERRFAAGAWIGTLWGAGHTVTLALAGAAIVALDVPVRGAYATALELGVAVMLIALGAWRVRDAARGLSRLRNAPRVPEHDHGGQALLHSHPHPHVHPERTLVAALRAPRHAWRPLLVGAVHGLSGSAAISLMIVTATGSAWDAVRYLGLFGLGTILGMTALTALLAYPTGFLMRVHGARRAVAATAGLAAIAVGVLYGWRVLAV